jgi:hypothetical protein
MGLKTLLKGLRSAHSKETLPVTSSKNRTLKPGSLDSQVLLSGQYSPGININQDNNISRDLWDEAYAIISKEDPKLNEQFEDIIVRDADENGDLGLEKLGQWV